MRKLASIRRISSLSPIQGADFIELATIGGWQVVVKKGEFSVNSLCVFFEIDSLLPATYEQFSFLGKPITYCGKPGYRLRTIKLRGQLSQGLALPTTLFPELSTISEGLDVTAALNVIKYDNTPVLKSNDQLGLFPDFIPKTDQERIQNLTSYFTDYVGESFEETLKLDGSSMTVYSIPIPLKWYQRILSLFGFKYRSHHFGVCSRNFELKPSDSSNFWVAAKALNLEHKLPLNYALQGELVGPRIQSNHEQVSSLQFFIFDVFDIEAQRYLTPTERNSFCHDHDLPHVPVVSPSIKIFQECPNLQSLLARVDGPSMSPGTISEGRVYKSRSSRRSFKCINNAYLLRFES